MTIPKTIQHTAIYKIYRATREIEVELTQPAFEDIRRFVRYESKKSDTLYTLSISALYDFDEVVEYIRNCSVNSQSTSEPPDA